MTSCPSYPAQIVYHEVDDVTGPRRWTGRLLRQSACVDVGSSGGADRPRPVTWCPKFDIAEDPASLHCTVTFNGGNTTSSRRYATYTDVTTAMKAGIRWAARRFRIPEATGTTVTDEAIDWLRSQSGGESPQAIEVSRLLFTAYRAPEGSIERAVARAALARMVNERSRS
ncbi:MAG TPA: hypothetical protein VLE97_10695 [Gaiellaceae bacterium]|nr:hypothetical protein [Gaiellaceae bacterium]